MRHYLTGKIGFDSYENIAVIYLEKLQEMQEEEEICI